MIRWTHYWPSDLCRIILWSLLSDKINNWIFEVSSIFFFKSLFKIFSKKGTILSSCCIGNWVKIDNKKYDVIYGHTLAKVLYRHMEPSFVHNYSDDSGDFWLINPQTPGGQSSSWWRTRGSELITSCTFIYIHRMC